MNGFLEINGKSMDRLDDLEFFFQNYQEIYTEAAKRFSRQYDDEVARIDRDLIVLYDRLSATVAERSMAIDARIQELSYRADAAPGMGKKICLKALALKEAVFRNRNVYSPLRPLQEEIRQKRAEKDEVTAHWPREIEDRYQQLTETFNFINSHRLVLEEARREELINQALSKLSSDYHVINNVRLSHRRWSLLRYFRKPFMPCRITHVVIGPTGLFLVKMLLADDLNSPESQKCLHQAVYISRKVKQYLQMNDLTEHEVAPRTVIVTFPGSYSGVYHGESVDLASVDRLSLYVKRRKCRLANEVVDELVQLFTR